MLKIIKDKLLNSKQMLNGKSFEYSLLLQIKEKLNKKVKVQIINNNSFEIAKECFNLLSEKEKSENILYSSFAINFLLDLEPRLTNSLNDKDVLELEIRQDNEGKEGDVRDILIIRLIQKWEIGISAKNHHNAVKHSRLSNTIDFGNKWIGINNSDNYFKEVSIIFNKLSKIKKENPGIKWSDIGDYNNNVYKPILKSFVKEIKRLYEIDNKKVVNNLIKYLIGKKDFYKIIKNKKDVEIYGFNLNNTLNLPFKNINSKYKIPKVLLPTKIEKIDFKKDSKNTIILEMNNDWIISFRIHNASSKVEASLKFDIQLLKYPKTLFKNKLIIN